MKGTEIKYPLHSKFYRSQNKKQNVEIAEVHMMLDST